MNVVSEASSLRLGPLVLLGVVLGGVVERLLVVVVGGPGYFALGALRSIDYLRQVGRLGLLVQAHIDLAVDPVKLWACVWHRVLGASALELRLSIALHHVLDGDVAVGVGFLGLGHA